VHRITVATAQALLTSPEHDILTDSYFELSHAASVSTVLSGDSMRKAHGDLGAYVAHYQDIYVLVSGHVGNIAVLFFRCHTAEANQGRFDVDKRPFTENP